MSGPRVLDHVAVAVDDLDAAIDRFTLLLGVGPDEITENDTFGVRVAIFRSGRAGVELLEGTRPDSAIARYVEKNGPGLHHLCFGVGDLAAVITELGEAGFEVIGDGGEIGAEGYPVAFVHPKSTGGVLLEFIETADRTNDGDEDGS